MSLRKGFSSFFFALLLAVSMSVRNRTAVSRTPEDEQLRAASLQRDHPQRQPTASQGLRQRREPGHDLPGVARKRQAVDASARGRKGAGGSR